MGKDNLVIEGDRVQRLRKLGPCLHLAAVPMSIVGREQ